MELKFKKEKDAFDAFINMVAKYVSIAKNPDCYKTITITDINYGANDGDALCEIKFSNDYYIYLFQSGKRFCLDIQVDSGSNKSNKYYLFERTDIINDLYNFAMEIYKEKKNES